jgi:nucleoside-diphosphate-sugar epimerase
MTEQSVAIIGAGGYLAGPIARHLKEKGGYRIVALVRPTTDVEAISQIADDVKKGNLADAAFVKEATKGCCAIVNFVNQLMPPCETVLEQLANDLGPLQAGLEAALAHDATFIHTSGNCSLPTKVITVFTNQLPAKPDGATGAEEHWETVSALAEAKHRQDWALQDFVAANPNSKACAILPAGVYGPGIGKKISFWDFAAAQFLKGQFVDFAHSFIHMDDISKVYLSVVVQGGNTPGGRFPAYGENMTVREFIGRYAKACGEPMVEDGPRCSDEEAARVYDDSSTREEFKIVYEHTLDSSIDDAVANLRQRNLILVVGPEDA